MKILFRVLPLFLGLLLSAAPPFGSASGKKADIERFLKEAKETPNIAQLPKELEDKNPDIRKNAVYKVWKNHGSMPPLLREALARRLNDKEKHVRYFTAAYVLDYDVHRNTIIDRPLTIALCIEALNDETVDLEVINRIIINLQDFKENPGAKRNEIISALKRRLISGHKHIRYKAAAALGVLDYANSKKTLMPIFLQAGLNREVQHPA